MKKQKLFRLLDYKVFWIPYKRLKNLYLIPSLKLWWNKRNEKCAWCGWYLHRGKNKPMKLVHWKIRDVSVCHNCANTYHQNYK